ncbi:hypothetical protein AB0D66_28400 [Streptomyces sp. NPDC048270]|uniref:hypothetical protein n=1 Tax=Streptomyces sp. NPDC048270 TaxID=3154615 RepID=UPI0033F34296
MKAIRTVVHDITLMFSLPYGLAAQPGAIRRYIEELQPGVLAAACTDANLDQVADIALVEVLGVAAPTEEAGAGVRDGR